MLTARDAVEDRVRGLDSGADDYLTKPFSLAELLARLRALVRRGASERPTLLEAGDLQLDPAARRVWRGDVEIELSAREFGLLETFIRNPGRVFSQFELLDAAWDLGYEQRSNVVEVYVGYLRQKVDRPFGVRSLETVRGLGYRLRNDGGRRVSRLPIRVRLTAVFAAAMIAVLAGAALFVYIRLRDDLDDAVNASLAVRADAVAAAGDPVAAAGDPEETFAAVDDAGGREAGLTDRVVPGIEGTARVLVRPLGAGRVVVVGQSLDDRDEALAGLLAAFAVGGPIAVLVASLLGYALAQHGAAAGGGDASPRRTRLTRGRRSGAPPSRRARRDPSPGRDVERDARPPAAIVRARAALRRRRRARAAHADRGRQDRARDAAPPGSDGGGASPRRRRSITWHGWPTIC